MQTQPLYDEINFRPYLEQIIQQWRWVIAIPIITGLLAFVISQALPESYESTALVAVTQPRFSLNDLGPIDPATPFRAFPELALSDQIIEELFRELDPLPVGLSSPDQLKDHLSAENGADPSIVLLTASFNDPQVAEVVVNTWALKLIDAANFVFGNQGGRTVAFFEEQVQLAQERLQTAENALVAFQAENREISLGNRLESLSQDQLVYQRDLRQIASALQEVQFLRNRLSTTDAPETSTNAMAVQLLQAKVLNIDADESQANSQNIQLQLSLDEREMPTAQQRAMLLDLEQLLIEKQASTLNRLEEIDAEIITVQQELQADLARLNQLNVSRNLAEETFESLAIGLEESQISSQEAALPVQLASLGTAPTQPTGFSSALLAILAAMFGLFVFVGASFLSLWWRQG